MKSSLAIVLGVCFIGIIQLKISQAAVSVEEDLSVSALQKTILQKFKERVLPRLPHDYMKTDIYLIRWLRARDFDIDETEKFLLQNLRWRRENRIDDLDEVFEKDVSYFKKGFGYSVDSVNNLGQPLLIIDQDKWDVRNAVVTGRRDRLVLWMVKMLEDATKKVLEQQDKGLNVTRWSMVNTLENFNLIESGCIQCLTVYISFVNNYEAHYPNMIDQLILVNTPGIFDTVLTLIRPVMTPGTRQALRLMGTNKREWQAELRQEIPKDQLPPELGGNKVVEDNETY